MRLLPTSPNSNSSYKATLTTAVLAALTIASPTAHSKEGGSVGNGGNAKVCFNGRPEIAARLTKGIDGVVAKMIPDQDLPFITSVETLDLADAKRPQGVDRARPDLVEMLPGEKPHEFAMRLAKPLEPFGFDIPYMSFFPTRLNFPAYLKNGISAIGDRITFVPDAQVFPVDDINPLTTAGDSCVYATVAVQRPVGNGKRELVIDSRLYDRMNGKLSQAVLFMHEYYLAAFSKSVSRDGSTDGLRELISAFLQKKSTLSTLVEIVVRRDLLNAQEELPSFKSISGAHVTSMEELLLEINEEASVHSQRIHSAQATELLKELEPIYRRLPEWYRRANALHELNVFEPIDEVVITRRLWRTHWIELNEKDLTIIRELHARQKAWETKNFLPTLLAALQPARSSREARFESIMESLAATGVIPPQALRELRNGLTEFVVSGHLEVGFDLQQEFTRIQTPFQNCGPRSLNCPDPISITVNPEMMSAVAQY